MSQAVVKEIIRQLKNGEITAFGVPEDYKNNKNNIQIVTFERKAGLCVTRKKGFDVIINSFFVEETLQHKNILRRKPETFFCHLKTLIRTMIF